MIYYSLKDGFWELVMTVEQMHSIFTHIPTLETERLVMRRLLPSDARDMYEYASRHDLTKYLLWDPHPDISYTADYLAYLQERYDIGDFFDWALVLKDSGKMIGTAGFTNFDLPNNTAEIGYVLNPTYHGRAFATEAASRVVDFGFTVLGLSRICAVCMKENQASLGVMRKIGMSFEGTLRQAIYVKGEQRDVSLSAIVRSEYKTL